MDSNSSSLFSLAHHLLTYGLDGSPIYADQFARLNRDVYERAIELYNTRGTTVEEEAELCLGLLVAFAALFMIMVVSRNVFRVCWIVAGRCFQNFLLRC